MRLAITFNDENRRQILFAGILTIIVVSGLFTYMVSLFAFISPSQEQRWSGSVLSLTPSTIHRGDTVYITAFYEEGSEYKLNDQYYSFVSLEDVQCVFIVLDKNNKPIFMHSEPKLGAQDDITLTQVSFVLPSTAVTGTYRVRVFVWTAWLPGGESRTYTIDEYTFEVV